MSQELKTKVATGKAKKSSGLLDKNVVLPALAAIAIIALGVWTFVLNDAGSKAVFADLNSTEEELYSLKVPDGWTRESEEEELVYYFDGDDRDSASHSIIVGFDADALPGFGDLSDEEKDQTIEFLKSSFTAENFSAPETEVEFDALEAVVSEHPEAERALNVALTGADQAGTRYIGEGRLIITPGGGVYLVIVATTEQVYGQESTQVIEILDTFDVL